MKYPISKKPVSSFTICPALVIKAFTYTNAKGKPVNVPVNTYVYVDTAQNIALVGKDHVDIGEDEYRCIEN